MKLTHEEKLVNELLDSQITTSRMEKIRLELIESAITLKGKSISDELHIWNERIKEHINLSSKRLAWPYPCDIAHIIYLLRKQ